MTDICPKAYSSHSHQWHPVGQELLSTEGGGLHAEIAVSSDSHLQIGHGWSDQHHLDCFKYSQSAVPRLVCSRFSEANAWNCGSLCHGYSLLIMYLTSPPGGVSVSVRQLTGCSSEYYL